VALDLTEVRLVSLEADRALIVAEVVGIELRNCPVTWLWLHSACDD